MEPLLNTELLCATPLEKFVIVLKEEMETMYEEIKTLRKEIIDMKEHIPTPMECTLVGSKVATRWFMRLYTSKNISRHECASILYTKARVPYTYIHVVNRGYLPPYSFVTELFIQCNKYMMLGNIATNIVNAFEDYLEKNTPSVYILNLDRTSDGIHVSNDILSLQMKTENTSIASRYLVKDGEIVEKKIALQTNFALEMRCERPCLADFNVV